MNLSQSESISAKQSATYAIPLSAVKVNKRNSFQLSDALTVVVLNDGQNIKVVHDLCPHMGGPISRGHTCKQTGGLVCPWHGYIFSQKTLTLETNPNEKIWIQPLAGDDAKTFETPKYKLKEIAFRLENDQIIIQNH